MLKKLGRKRESVVLLPMFRRRDNAFLLHAIDYLRCVNRSVGFEDGVDVIGDFLRANADETRAFPGGWKRNPDPEAA
jgi:hypothetical protein